MQKVSRVTKFLTMFVSVCLGISLGGGFFAPAQAFAATSGGPTPDVISRLSDNDTTDDYIGKLISDDVNDTGSRYAGRIWTDKSVFAHSYDSNAGTYANGNWDGENLKLDEATDDYDGTVNFNSDFAHVFSALGSSQLVNVYPPKPLDVVMLLDISTSMATNINSNSDPLHQMLNDANDLITQLMNNPSEQEGNKSDPTISTENRVGVVVYGGGTQELMPLAHYTRNSDSDYLTVGGTTPKGTGSSVYFPKIKANVANGKTSGFMFGDSTYLQGALYQGMNMLANAADASDDATLTEEERIPVLIVLSDGGTNVVTANNVTGTATYAYTFNDALAYNDSHQTFRQFEGPQNPTWNNPYIGIMPVAGTSDNTRFWPLVGNPVYGGLSNEEQLPGDLKAAIMTSNLLLAGTLQKRIEEHYGTDMLGYSILLNAIGLGLNEKEMMYTTLDPANYLKADSVGPGADIQGESDRTNEVSDQYSAYCAD